MALGSVIVVGAGIAGLTAGYRLSKAGFDVTILEASECIGGRMSTDRYNGYLIDRGAQFLSDGYSAINELISELGLTQRRVSGWAGIVRNGLVRRIHARRPWTIATSGLINWGDAFRMACASAALAGMTWRIPLSDYSRWSALDHETAEKWISSTFGQNALQFIFEPMLEGLFFQAPDQMSRAWPSVLWNFGLRGKRATAIVGGLGSLPEALARKANVRLNTPVEKIDANGLGIKVKTQQRLLQSDFVVLATTPSAAREIYSPAQEVEKRLIRTGFSSTINISLALRESIPNEMVDERIYGLLIPRRERKAIASVGIESRKIDQYVPQGELLNVMLSGSAGARLLHATDKQVLAEVLPELECYFPGIAGRIEFERISRWAEAEPLSPIGRSRDLREYRRIWHPRLKVILAGDYMSIPCTEGAAESGNWAANTLIKATAACHTLEEK